MQALGLLAWMLHASIWGVGYYLLQLLLCREAQTIDCVCPAVGPLAKLVGGLREGHVGSDGAVDDGLVHTPACTNTHTHTHTRSTYCLLLPQIALTQIHLPLPVPVSLSAM